MLKTAVRGTEWTQTIRDLETNLFAHRRWLEILSGERSLWCSGIHQANNNFSNFWNIFKPLSLSIPWGYKQELPRCLLSGNLITTGHKGEGGKGLGGWGERKEKEKSWTNELLRFKKIADHWVSENHEPFSYLDNSHVMNIRSHLAHAWEWDSTENRHASQVATTCRCCCLSASPANSGQAATLTLWTRHGSVYPCCTRAGELSEKDSPGTRPVQYTGSQV